MTGEVRALSAGQQSLWLLYKLAPGSAAYNEANAVRFTPAPRTGELARAVAAVAERHDLLRSVFTDSDDGAVRVIGGTELVTLEISDVPEAADEELAELARQAGARPLRLEETGPFRAVLFRRAADAVLVIATHHIATDALSQRLIWRDVIEAYRAFTAGELPQWPDLPATYDDYVRKEQELLASERRLPLEEYWQRICSGAVAAELPPDRPRPASPAFAGATVSRQVPAELAARVEATAKALGVTPFTVMLGAFQGLLHRYTGGADLTIGCPTALRRGHKLRDVVGLLVNSMVLRSRYEPGTTFAELITAAGTQLAEGVPRIGYPYSLLNAARGSRDPLFRIGITMVKPQHGDTLPYLGESAELAGHHLYVLDLPHMEGQADLTVEIAHMPRSMTVIFRYDTELFDRPGIERLLGHFLRMVSAACADLTARVSRVSMMDDAERERLLALGAG
ncbi:condensation domain-containing protein [Longispora albida]|uniref:condensation domain-containing protein n=1 Tax=Longispora albida TaxID=203523 RepID=UPI0003623888|nr:condensation domain-containing protein [Longispora albida]